MLNASPKLSGRIVFALLTVIGFSVVSACARTTTTSEAQPEVAPQEKPTASELTSGEIEKQPHESVAHLLQGRMAGVSVVEYPNGTISVRIRGPSSFYGNTEPLYIVDGVPFRPGPGGALTGLNPYDIESIEVLKRPPETSLYGVRGANGVILITTRRP